MKSKFWAIEFTLYKAVNPVTFNIQPESNNWSLIQLPICGLILGCLYYAFPIANGFILVGSKCIFNLCFSQYTPDDNKSR